MGGGHHDLRALDDTVEATSAAARGEQPDPLRVELRDGSHAALRPILPADGGRLQEGLQRLSLESRYYRFHSSVNRLTDEQIRYLTEVDHVDHVAWVALDPERPDLPGMGVARYVRVDPGSNVAEAAVTVADEYQGRGLGTLLLGVISTVARANGIDVLRNYVLDANAAMLGLFDELGATREPDGDGAWRVDLPVPADLQDLPDSAAGRALRAVGRPSETHRGLFGLAYPAVWPWREHRDG